MAVVHPAEKVGELVVVWSNHRGAVSILDHEDVNRENGTRFTSPADIYSSLLP